MPGPYEGHEFEALRARYDEQVQLLRFMTTLDHRIFSGYITLQLALGAWVATHAVTQIWTRIGLSVIDLVLAGIAGKLLYNDYRRRQEVVVTLTNLNEALGYSIRGAYLPDERVVNAETNFRPWWYWYLVGIVAAVVGVAMILFGGA